MQQESNSSVTYCSCVERGFTKLLYSATRSETSLLALYTTYTPIVTPLRISMCSWNDALCTKRKGRSKEQLIYSVQAARLLASGKAEGSLFHT